jgi:hypothetical protein
MRSLGIGPTVTASSTARTCCSTKICVLMDESAPIYRSCTEQLVDALVGEHVDDPLTWKVTVPSLLAAAAEDVEELTWNIQTILVEAVNRISRRTDSDVLDGISAVVESFMLFSDCRESIMLAQSSCRQTSSFPGVAFTIQQLCLGTAACAKRPRGVPINHLVDSLKVLQTLTVSVLSEPRKSFSREETRRGISLAAAAVLVLWQYREGATCKRQDDGVDALQLLELHFALSFILLVRACVIWSAVDANPHVDGVWTILQGSLHMLHSELSVGFADLLHWYHFFATFGELETGACSRLCTCTMCARLSWIRGPGSGLQAYNDSDASDEDEGSHNPLLRGWCLKTRETSAFRSGIAHVILAGLTNLSAASVCFDLLSRSNVSSGTAPPTPVTVPCLSTLHFPFVYSFARFVSLLLPVLHQFASEHAAVVSSANSPDRHESTAVQLRAMLGVVATLLTATEEFSRAIQNVDLLHVSSLPLSSADHTEVAERSRDSGRNAPSEVHMLQSLFTCIVRESDSSFHQELLTFVQCFLSRLNTTALFHVSLALIESCPFQTVSAMLIDYARKRTSATISASSMSIHHLNNIVVLAIDCRIRMGLVLPANIPRSSPALTEEQRAHYLSSHAEMDGAILSAIRYIALSVRRQPQLLKANAAELGYVDMKVLNNNNIKEYYDLFGQPLVNAIAQSQKYLRERHGIMALHPHPTPFLAVEGGLTEPQTVTAGSAEARATLSKLFLLDAAATPTIQALEGINDLLHTA